VAIVLSILNCMFYNRTINTVNLFKARLDRFWANLDVKYNFTADLTGIGDRSAYDICDI